MSKSSVTNNQLNRERLIDTILWEMDEFQMVSSLRQFFHSKFADSVESFEDYWRAYNMENEDE